MRVNDRYERQAPELRARRQEHVFADELLTALDATTSAGFDRLPVGLDERAVAERLAA